MRLQCLFRICAIALCSDFLADLLIIESSSLPAPLYLLKHAHKNDELDVPSLSQSGRVASAILTDSLSTSGSEERINSHYGNFAARVVTPMGRDTGLRSSLKISSITPDAFRGKHGRESGQQRKQLRGFPHRKTHTPSFSAKKNIAATKNTPRVCHAYGYMESTR